MTFITLLSVIIFVVILIVRIILRRINKKKLDSIRGFGGVFKKGHKKGNMTVKNQKN